MEAYMKWLVKIKMPVKVRIINLIDPEFKEFSSISKAANLEILGKNYTKRYISELISGSIIRVPNVLDFLNIRAKRSEKCVFNDCNTQTFNNFGCEDCDDRELCYKCEDGNISKEYICPYCDGSV